MNRNRTLLRLALPLLAGLLLSASTVLAQTPADQLVESQEAFQRRIEMLVRDRLTAMLPRGNFVMRAIVVGEQVRVPVSGRAAAATQTAQPALPGFHPIGTEDQPETPTEERFRVDQVVVRVVINEDLPQADLEYLRTIIPILADFDNARGDRLDLQVVAPEPTPEEAALAAQAGAQPEPGAVLAGVLGPSVAGMPIAAWVLLGLLVLAVLWLLFRRPRVQPAPEPPQIVQAPPPPPSPSAQAEAALREAEAESRRERQLQERQDGLRNAVVKQLFARTDLARQLMTDWTEEPAKLNTLIHALGPSVARGALLPNMDRERYRSIEQAVRLEDTPERDVLIDVLREANLYLISQDLAQPEQIEADPFRFLDELTPGQIAWLVKDEPVRIKAIVLSRLEAEPMAQIMEQLPRDVQLEVAVNIGNLQDLPLGMLTSVANQLADKSHGVPDARTVAIQGPQTLVDLMGRASAETSRYLLQAMKSKDRRLSEQVERRYFRFEAIPQVPDDVLPNVVRTVPSTVVVQSLQGSAPDLARKVIMAFPEQARPGLVNSVRAAQFDQATVDNARRQIVARFQELAEQGRVDLKQITDAWQAASGGDAPEAEAEAS